MNLNGIRVGTSSFTAAGWETSFYPAGMKPADYLTYYATKFDTVEVDSTYYRTPAVSTVQRWRTKTPDGFIFALKVPAGGAAVPPRSEFHSSHLALTRNENG